MMCGFGVRAHRYFQCRAGMSRDGRQPQALVSRTRTSNLALVTFTSDDHHARECRVRRIPGDLGLTVPMPGRSFPSHLLPWWTLTWGKVVPEVHRRGQSPSCLSPRTCRIRCLFARRHWNDGAIRQMAREPRWAFLYAWIGTTWVLPYFSSDCVSRQALLVWEEVWT